jgi:hypothetical protein
MKSVPTIDAHIWRLNDLPWLSGPLSLRRARQRRALRQF